MTTKCSEAEIRKAGLGIGMGARCCERVWAAGQSWADPRSDAGWSGCAPD